MPKPKGLDRLHDVVRCKPYAREALSTWAEFEKLTGLDLPGSCIVAKPVRRKTRQRA